VANFHDSMVLSNGKVNQTLFVDGLHPNKDGYNEMWYVLRPILVKLTPAQ
jgi:lysophospholipase L1-like esterase